MAISVAQSASGGALPLNFSTAVTAGNTVFLIVGGYTNSGGACSSSSPTLGGSPVSGSAAFFNPGGSNGLQSTGSPAAYAAIWMMPNCPGGSVAVGLTTSFPGGGLTGAMAFEVSGLGATPVLDQSVSATATTGTTVNTGATGSITAAPELILCADQTYGGSSSNPSGGWTATNISTNTWAGYQIATSSGGTYNWTQTVTSGPWAAGIVTIAAALASAAGTVQPASTLRTPWRRPSRAVVQFTPVVTVNTGHGPAGRAQPLAASLVAPRRRPARAVVQFIPVTTTNGPAKPHPQHGTPSSDEARGWKRWLLWGP